MSDSTNEKLLLEAVNAIDIPESAYAKAETRYRDLGDWLGRAEAACSPFLPHVYPQGSFRLGTVTRPLKDEDEYDLDFGCRLRRGITKVTHTQRQLKELVGIDIASYRTARGIVRAPEEKRRCWRLCYADELKFHIDAVPSIPEGPIEQMLLTEAMARFGLDQGLARIVAGHSGAVSDRQSPWYSVISPEWRSSNSEGYALWFESRVRLGRSFLEKRALEAKVARVDDLPANRWRSPLQRSVQLLKRHRDVMFRDKQQSKPISIVITTLAGLAYQGDADLDSTLQRVLTDMGLYVQQGPPRVPNPVNPSEDFADKWADPTCAALRLEDNFWAWLRAAQTDFDAFRTSRSSKVLLEKSRVALAANLEASRIASIVGSASGPLLRDAVVPSGLSFPDKPLVPPKPAGFANLG